MAIDDNGALRVENLGLRITLARIEIARLQAIERDLVSQQQIVLGELRQQAGVEPNAVYDPQTRTFTAKVGPRPMMGSTGTVWPPASTAAYEG